MLLRYLTSFSSLDHESQISIQNDARIIRILMSGIY